MEESTAFSLDRSPPPSPTGALTPNTRSALRRAAIRRSGGESDRALTREGSSTFSVPPPPFESPAALRTTRLLSTPPPPPSPYIGTLPEGLSSGKKRPERLEEVRLRPAPSDVSVKSLPAWDMEHAPTDNVFALKALSQVHDSNPWKGRALYLMTPPQMSAIVENMYFSRYSMHQSLLYRPETTDIVVCGVLRTGHSPIIQMLQSLKDGVIVPPQELTRRVPWIEGFNTDLLSDKSLSRPRILKTHSPVRNALGGVTTRSFLSNLPSTFKLVVVLRDPADLRLSWFRHVRRVFKKFNPGERFDSHLKVNDFAKEPRGALKPQLAHGMFGSPEYSYENFVREVIVAYENQRREKDNILIVFYEELVANPLDFAKRVQEFLKLPKATDQHCVHGNG